MVLVFDFRVGASPNAFNLQFRMRTHPCVFGTLPPYFHVGAVVDSLEFLFGSHISQHSDIIQQVQCDGQISGLGCKECIDHVIPDSNTPPGSIHGLSRDFLTPINSPTVPRPRIISTGCSPNNLETAHS